MDSSGTVARTKPSGDIKNVRIHSSNESMISVLFPWRGENNPLKRRTPLVSDNESGRITSPTDFYLCMMAVLLLCTSAGLTTISAWLILYRIPFLYLTDGSFFMESHSFIFFASLVSIPCFWITWICHYHKKNYVFIPLLIVILGFSLTLLSIGISIGLVQKSKIVFDRSTDPPKLLPTRFKTDMNETMRTTMALYNTNLNYRYAWDKIQQRLRCCGIERPDDWLRYGHVPKSCYFDRKCSHPKSLYLKGCLDALSYDFAWEICLLTGLSMITFAVQIASLMLAVIVYVKEKTSPGYGDSP